MKYDLENIEAISLDAGDIYIVGADVNKSAGFLRLDPGKELAKHNRPVDEWLVQIDGESIVKLFDGDKITREVLLRRGDELRIPANQYHQHTNQARVVSLTSWQFDGDIMNVISVLRA